MISKTYAVFGLGRYGRAVATELVESGAEVIAVDIDEKRAEEMIEILPVCKCADVTDPDVIKKLGISNCETVIISFASNFEASIMATMLCKEAGVTLTPAGATFPYGKDPDDKNIRIAPSFPSLEELQKATEVLCLAIKLASAEKMLESK